MSKKDTKTNLRDMAKYIVSLDAKNFMRTFVTIPREYLPILKKITARMRVRGNWDRRAKAECKAFGVTPTRFFYHARNVNGKDVFVDSGNKAANNKWGLFPSKDSLNTAWGELKDKQKEDVAYVVSEKF